MHATILETKSAQRITIQLLSAKLDYQNFPYEKNMIPNNTILYCKKGIIDLLCTPLICLVLCMP